MANQIIPEELAEKPQPQPGDHPDDTAAKTKTWTLYSPDGTQSVLADANTDTGEDSAYEGWTKAKPKAPAA